MDKKDKLNYLLRKVHDSYDDFVVGVLNTAQNHNGYDKIIAFIENDPSAFSSDIIRYMTEAVLGIEPTDS